MKNSEVVIRFDTPGSHRRILKQSDHWVMTVSSSSRSYKMSAEQLLSHLLPALLPNSKVQVTVTPRQPQL